MAPVPPLRTRGLLCGWDDPAKDPAAWQAAGGLIARAIRSAAGAEEEEEGESEAAALEELLAAHTRASALAAARAAACWADTAGAWKAKARVPDLPGSWMAAAEAAEPSEAATGEPEDCSSVASADHGADAASTGSGFLAGDDEEDEGDCDARLGCGRPAADQQAEAWEVLEERVRALRFLCRGLARVFADAAEEDEEWW